MRRSYLEVIAKLHSNLHRGQYELLWSTLVTLTALVNSRCPTESGQLSLSWPTWSAYNLLDTSGQL